MPEMPSYAVPEELPQPAEADAELVLPVVADPVVAADHHGYFM